MDRLTFREFWQKLTKKQIAGIVLFFFLSFICKWFGIIYLSILFKIAKTNNTFYLIVSAILLFMYIQTPIKKYFEDKNSIISEVAYELDIDDYPIQKFYSDIGYRTEFIGVSSGIIFATASKIVTLPCQEIDRYDMFSINGNHIEKLTNYEDIPKVVYEKTYKISRILSNNSK